jgi:hypothetical protein
MAVFTSQELIREGREDHKEKRTDRSRSMRRLILLFALLRVLRGQTRLNNTNKKRPCGLFL